MTTDTRPRLRSLSSWPDEFKDAVCTAAIAIGVSVAAVFALSDEPQSRIYVVGSLPMQNEIKLDVTETPKHHLGRPVDGAERNGIAFTSVEERISYTEASEPLDVVFVGPDGIVKKVHSVDPTKNASLPTPEASALVIEVPRGKARFYGLKPGAKVSERTVS